MRANLILTTALSALIALLPLQAAAQDISRERDPAAQVGVLERPRPEYDPLGVRLGGFDLHAALALAVTSTDNVLVEETDADDDIIMSAAPSATLASHWSRHSLAFRAGGYADNHNDFSQDDITNAYAGVDGRLDVLRSGEAGAGGSLNKEHELRSNPDSPDGIAEPVEFQRNNMYAYARYGVNRVRLTGRVERNDYDYDDVPLSGGGILDQDFRDHDETVGTLRGEIAITPRLAAVLEASANERDYDAPLRDSDGNYFAAGVSFDVTDLIRGQALVTQYQQDYDDPSIGSVDGAGFYGNVEWFPTQLTTVNAEASRTVEESALVGASYVRTEGGVSVAHELRRNIILTAGVRAERREYEGISRSDDLMYADVGATYMMNRRVRVNAGYSFGRNDSNDDERDFEENRLSAGVTLLL